MNWEVLSAVAEVAGALGVVASLLYLGTQIQNQNRQARLDVVNELARQRNEYSGNIADNGELADIWFRGLRGYSELPDIERVRFSAHVARIARVMESLYEHRTEDQVTGDNWEAFDVYIRDVFGYPGVQEWWETRSHYFTKSFQAHVGRHIKANEGRKSLWLES